MHLYIYCQEMRRSSYHDRPDRYQPKTAKPPPPDIYLNNLKVATSRLDNNFLTGRTSNYYHPKMVKHGPARPYTTQKAQGYVQLRRETQVPRHHPRQELAVSGGSDRRHLVQSHQEMSRLQENPYHQDDSHPDRESMRLEHSKGRLFRGSSWKYEEKSFREASQPATTRYQSQRRDSFQQEGETRARKGGLLDLLGQNLKKGEGRKEDDFFQYIMRFSYRTKKGYIPTNPNKVNQDNFIVSPNLNGHSWQHFFAVCDGHGPLGHQVSGYLKSTLPAAVASCRGLERHPRQALTRAFETAYERLLKESGVDLSFSGSTIISCYFQQSKLVCANVGDSRAIVGRMRAGAWEAVPLSTDHKPSIEKEAERIRKMRGRVQPFRDEVGEAVGPLRVWVQGENVPGLAMTRSFGDLVGASVGVSPVPEIKEFSLCEQDRIVLLASDGVFEFLSNQAIIRALVPFYEGKQIQQASDHLMTMATKSWTKNSSIIDDITFILIFLNYNEL